MFNLFKKKKSPKEVAFNTATGLYGIVSAAANSIESNQPEKVELATNLYMLGVLDCLSQRFNMTEEGFFDLLINFYEAIGLNGTYMEVLMLFFTKMEKLPKARECVVEGGKNCNEFLNGNTSIPVAAMWLIEGFVEDKDFPDSAGHVYVAIK